MVRIIGSGTYKLTETKDNQKILSLGKYNNFQWVSTGCEGQIKYVKLDPKQICCLLSTGNYRIYEVKNELGLSNSKHIELHVGRGKWQGYLLPKGLPAKLQRKRVIVQTNEIITKSSKNPALV